MHALSLGELPVVDAVNATAVFVRPQARRCKELATPFANPRGERDDPVGSLPRKGFPRPLLGPCRQE